jgi:hypothetical protein
MDTRDEDYHDFHETWLRIAKNINQSGKPCALFTAGSVIPNSIDPRIERRCVSTVHYLALVADDETLRERLRERPDWRGTTTDEFIQRQFEFSRWLQTSKESADHHV